MRTQSRCSAHLECNQQCERQRDQVAHELDLQRRIAFGEGLGQRIIDAEAGHTHTHHDDSRHGAGPQFKPLFLHVFPLKGCLYQPCMIPIRVMNATCNGETGMPRQAAQGPHTAKSTVSGAGPILASEHDRDASCARVLGGRSGVPGIFAPRSLRNLSGFRKLPMRCRPGLPPPTASDRPIDTGHGAGKNRN